MSKKSSLRNYSKLPTVFMYTFKLKPTITINNVLSKLKEIAVGGHVMYICDNLKIPMIIKKSNI